VGFVPVFLISGGLVSAKRGPSWLAHCKPGSLRRILLRRQRIPQTHVS